jgi:hypothetical protein
MMTSHTVQQLLQVFRHFRENHASGMSLHRSYSAGVRAVAKEHAVTYQTIGDGCRRRLRLTEINQLYELLAAWVKGDPRGLVRQLKENSDPVAGADIDQFFASGDGPSSPVETRKPSLKAPSREESETFSFRLPAPDARMLKALAELEGVSVGELTAREVAVAVRDRITAVARGIVKNAESRG